MLDLGKRLYTLEHNSNQFAHDDITPADFEDNNLEIMGMFWHPNGFIRVFKYKNKGAIVIEPNGKEWALIDGDWLDDSGEYGKASYLKASIFATELQLKAKK